MKLTRTQLRYLIKEELTGLTTGAPDEKEGLVFGPGGPTDEEYYGIIAQGLKDSKAMEEMLKNSAVDVNFIVVPEMILKTLRQYAVGDILGSPNLYHTSVDQGILSKIFQSGQAYVKGQNKMLDALRTQYQSNAFNIVIQRDDRDNLGAVFSVPWMIHDVVGHALNFDNYGMIMQSLAGVFKQLTTLGKVDPKTFETGRDFEKQMGVGSLNPADKNLDLQERLLKFFEENNFTADPFDFDVGASIIAYYFIYGELPPPIESAIDSGEIDVASINEYKSKMDKIFQSLIGKVSYVNFGPHSVSQGN